MAASDSVCGLPNDVKDGHYIQYSDRLPIFADQPAYVYNRSFSFYCSVAPTSWSFSVTFERQVNDGSMSCIVTVSRSDQSRIRINMEFWMAVFCGTTTQLPPRSFKVQAFPPCRTLTRTLNGVMPPEVLQQLGDRGILLQVTFAVHGCHENECNLVFGRGLADAIELCECKALHSKM